MSSPARLRMCASELDALHERFGIEEFVIDTPIADYAQRLASVEALGTARTAAHV